MFSKSKREEERWHKRGWQILICINYNVRVITDLQFSSNFRIAKCGPNGICICALLFSLSTSFLFSYFPSLSRLSKHNVKRNLNLENQKFYQANNLLDNSLSLHWIITQNFLFIIYNKKYWNIKYVIQASQLEFKNKNATFASQTHALPLLHQAISA